MKEARISYNKTTDQWVIRYWSEKDEEWKTDSSYFIQYPSKDADIGLVSETLLFRLSELQDLGYELIIIG